MSNQQSKDFRAEVFKALKAEFKPYESKLVIISNFDSRYELRGDNDYEVKSEKTGKVTKKHGAYFGGIIIQSSYVGLYLMAPYSHPQKFTLEDFPNLLPMLKGKSCFHIKSIDQELLLEVGRALELSFQIYQEEGLV